MKKETIMFDNIKQDFLDLVKFNFNVKNDWRLFFIFLGTLSSIIFFLLFWAIGEIFLGLIVSLVIFILPAYNIIRIIRPYIYYKSMSKYLQSITDREQFSISVENLSHITKEQIYEPHLGVLRLRMYTYKEVCFFHFGVGEWRLPEMKYYRWSNELYMGPKTLETNSTKGDEFYYISLQGYSDVTFVYPCKFFRLDNNLIKK